MKIKENTAGKVLVVLYSHPELYPPTLNAVINLAAHYKEVHVLYRRHKKDEWKWPPNVHLHPAGKLMSTRAFMLSSFRTRLTIHLRFALKFFVLFKRIRPDILLLYDPYPALFYRVLHRVLPRRKPFLWYHNHDVIEPADLRNGGKMLKLLVDAEEWTLGRADLFTLPTDERKGCFDLQKLKGRYATIPNFPSKRVFSERPDRRVANDITLGFQGSICAARGLEGLTYLLPMDIHGKPVRLSITGFSNDQAYRQSLDELTLGLREAGVVRINEAVAYARLPEVMRNVNIGWVYYGKGSSLDNSMGTASNKFFECCAMGLPLLYNAQNTFEAYKNFQWAIPVELTRESIAESIAYIVGNYEQLSRRAYEQFAGELNFENAFEEMLKILPAAHG